MRKYLTLAAVAVPLCLVLTACQQPLPTQEDNDVTVNVNVGGQPSPSPSASPTPIAGCPVVARVTVGFSGAGGRTTTRVGVGEVLDVTPRAADNSEVPSQCHGSTVQWALAGSAICELTGNTAGFNPHVTCSTPGSFTATATVAPPGGTGATVFTVNP